MKKTGKGFRARWRRAQDWLMEYAYLVTLGAVIAVIAATAMYTSRVNAQQEEGVAAAAGAPETRETASPTPSVTPLPTIAPMTMTAATYRPAAASVWPASGGLLRAFSDTAVSWEALGCIQPHKAIDIAGEAGEEVFSPMDGVVKAAALDALWGWRVEIEHTDGSIGVYAGLLQSYVAAGDAVARGEALGLLMERIPCEAELKTHLHMELSFGGKAVDPAAILTQSR